MDTPSIRTDRGCDIRHNDNDCWRVCNSKKVTVAERINNCVAGNITAEVDRLNLNCRSLRDRAGAVGAIRYYCALWEVGISAESRGRCD